MLAKVRRLTQMVRCVAKLPFTDGKMMEVEEALAVLNRVWPDTGKPCYLEHPVPRETRVSLSVIIPSYNNEQYVGRCIESVLTQKTDISYEVIVVNDGSTDGTQELLEKNYGNTPRVRIINQKNKGLSGARNTGIDLATGAYLMFIDSDDSLLPGALDSLMRMALEKDASVVCGGYNCRYPDGKTVVGLSLADEKVSPMGRLPGYAWGKVYKTSIFEHLRFPEGYWFQDSISAQIIWPMNEDSFYTVKEQVCEYLINPQGISAQATRKPKALDSIWLYCRLLEERKLFGLTTTQADYEHFLEMARLTYVRTRGMDEEVKRSIFAIQADLKEKYFVGFASEGSDMNRRMEQALSSKAYKKYILLGELPHRGHL